MNILIADDHPIFRSSLRHVLSVMNEAVDVTEAGSFKEAATALDRAKFDLVLLDLLMPDMPPVDGLQLIVRAAPDAPVVVVSAIDNRRDAVQAIDIGAMGYIPKTATQDEFIRLLKLVLDGGMVLPKGLTDGPRNAGSAGSAAPRLPAKGQFAQLTRRQRQVLTLLAQGKSNIEIAKDLGVSDKTVRFYISAILKTLNVKNRTQAALLATGAMNADAADGMPARS
jgi:DNA-binding NarL/FixJ family response regulator